MPKANNARASQRRREFRWRPYFVSQSLDRSLAALTIVLCRLRSVARELQDDQEELKLIGDGLYKGLAGHVWSMTRWECRTQTRSDEDLP
jgi:hypothetical protein